METLSPIISIELLLLSRVGKFIAGFFTFAPKKIVTSVLPR
jgi:hypothetical protein